MGDGGRFGNPGFERLGEEFVRRRDELEAAIVQVQDAIARIEPFAVSDGLVRETLALLAAAEAALGAAEEAGDIEAWSVARRDLAVQAAWLGSFDPLQVERVRRDLERGAGHGGRRRARRRPGP
jgi:hypothetical protein